MLTWTDLNARSVVIVNTMPIRDRITPMMEMTSNASSASGGIWLHPSLLVQISYSV